MIKILKLILCILILFDHSTEVLARPGGSKSSGSKVTSSKSHSTSSSHRLRPTPSIARKTTITRTRTTVPVITKKYVYTYSTYRSPRVYVNNYYSPITMRTYHPLVAYYHPIIFNPLGYYSIMYHRIYYDGYGYNFYYGGYGYYEYSVYPGATVHAAASGFIWGIVIAVIVVCCCIGCCCHRHHKGQSFEFESEGGIESERSGYVEEVVIHQELIE
jgi:hypothetical protein